MSCCATPAPHCALPAPLTLPHLRHALPYLHRKTRENSIDFLIKSSFCCTTPAPQLCHTFCAPHLHLTCAILRRSLRQHLVIFFYKLKICICAANVPYLHRTSLRHPAPHCTAMHLRCFCVTSAPRCASLAPQNHVIFDRFFQKLNFFFAAPVPHLCCCATPAPYLCHTMLYLNCPAPALLCTAFMLLRRTSPAQYFTAHNDFSAPKLHRFYG